MRTVIVNDQLGIYVGSCLGLGFWSKLDAVGQDSVPTFPSEAAAQAHIESWESSPEGDLSFRQVDTDEDYATIETLKKAGLEAYLGELEEAFTPTL